jgi:LysM repeat protein
MASIIKWNKIKDPNKIEVCQAIWYQKPPANAEEIVNKKAEKPVQRIATENKVIDQRKLNKMTSEKGIRPQAHSTEDEDYDSWRLKSSNASAQKPVAHDTEEEPAERPLIHRVKKGEYLYKLSKMYDCPEECIRQANKMPEEGDVDFIIGQRVVIPECDCLKSKTSAKKGVAYESPITTAKNKKMRSETLLDPVTYGYDEKDEKQVSTQTKRRLDEWEDDVDEKTTSVAKTKSSAKKSAASNVPQFKEHLSRQGDTLRSIATKYKVDPAELAQVNGMGLNEEVTPGKWILVPIHEPEEK